VNDLLEDLSDFVAADGADALQHRWRWTGFAAAEHGTVHRDLQVGQIDPP